MDGNLWAGPEVVKGDPNECNQNGRLFKEFLKKFPHLHVVNSLDICEGIITRRRVTIKKEEKAVLDFFVVCDLVLQFIVKMVIDEDKQYVLSNYFQKNGKAGKRDSDHNSMYMELSLNIPKMRMDRTEIYNFKNRECQEIFFDLTNNSTKLTRCFETNENIQKQGRKWFKNLNGLFQQSFKKVRITSNQKQTVVSKLFETRMRLIQELKVSKDEEHEDLIVELEEVEEYISNEVAKDIRDKIVDNFKVLADSEGSTNINGMWNLKNRIFPKHPKPVPVAKKNVDGRLITSHSEIKDLYLDTFRHRLRHRPMKEDLRDLENLKEELCSKRLQLSKMCKSKKLDIESLKKVILQLKKNKSRDAQGWINELFKPGVGGTDIENSLLLMFQKIKEDISFPEFMEYVNIIGIYKGKGSKMDLQNDRGIFIVNVIKSLFMKTVWSDVYPVLDKNMSDSNVGGRRGKNIRNHLFIVNGIINEVVNGKAEAIDIEVLDYKQCFDSMWLSESINDLYESGIKNDNLAIIHEANKHNLVAVKTPVGMTKRVPIEEIVMQGEVTGPGQCSNQIDTFGKECIKENKLLYNYKNELGIPPLGMVDDVLAVSLCGSDSVAMNAFLCQKTSMKRLQYGPDKCHQLHVGKSKDLCPELYIEEWKLTKKDELKTGIDNLVDELDEQHNIEKVLEDKYLGDILSVDGKNTKNIAAKISKAMGIVKKVRDILDNMCLGPYLFEVGVVLRNSLFLNGILTNLEASYGLTAAEVTELEQMDENLMRLILECPMSVPKEMLYLEMGVTPIRYILMSRRLMFYHYILKQPEESLIRRFYKTQRSNPSKNDWSLTVKSNLETLEVNASEEDIGTMSQYVFRKLVNTHIKKEAFKYLQKIKSTHTKVLHIQYTRLEIQSYFLPNKMPTTLAKFTFLCRTRMVQVGANFKAGNNFPLCPLCKIQYDSQKHLLDCSKLTEANTICSEVPQYDDLFSKDLKKMLNVTQNLKEKFSRRQKLLSKSD